MVGMSWTSWASSEAVSGLVFLLPGFIAAGIFHSLISNPRPNGFDVVIQSFVLTIFVQLIAQPFFWAISFMGWNAHSNKFFEVLILALVSVVFGLVFASIWNADKLHKLLRSWKITRQSSYQSAQYSAFAHHGDCYVVLHLKGQRRLYGWPKEWPSRPEDQHFLIEECEWLEDDNNRTPLKGVSHILVSATEVEMVEFLHSMS